MISMPLPEYKKKTLQRFVVYFVLTLAATIFSYYYLDHPLASFITLLHGNLSEPSLNEYNGSVSITDFFYLLVALGLFTYTLLRFFEVQSAYVKICGLLSLGVVVAFFIKTLTQVFFGRLPPIVSYATDTRFLHEGDTFFSCFPSGHMLIFTCFLMLWNFYYPKFRYWTYLALFGLACILIFRGYHYLSDIIAGTYGGAFIAVCMQHIFEIQPIKKKTFSALD